MTTTSKVSLELAALIMRARLKKGMTQKELALAVNEKLETIANYEAAKAIRSVQLVARLEKALATHLVGPKTGLPLLGT